MIRALVTAAVVVAVAAVTGLTAAVYAERGAGPVILAAAVAVAVAAVTAAQLAAREAGHAAAARLTRRRARRG